MILAGKPLEHRSALTPSTTKALIDAGYKVKVEKCNQRIFDDREFEAVGAEIVPNNSWREAPTDNIIVGLKELPEEDCMPSKPIVTHKMISDMLCSPTPARPCPIRTLLQEPRRMGVCSWPFPTRWGNFTRSRIPH